MARKAIVIGAGFGGLALAIRLQSAGMDTILVEARDRPGGRAYMWEKDGFTFDAANMEDYAACFCDPATIHASCEDYRAGWGIDRALDEADRGLRKITAPLLAVWSEGFSVARSEPLKTWSAWAENVSGHAVPGGHFVCEEQPERVGALLQDFFRLLFLVFFIITGQESCVVCYISFHFLGGHAGLVA